MDPGQTAASFHTTSWALVIGARGDRATLERLLRAYWSPVYGFIRRQGYGSHDASDLTQEFLSQVVIGRDLIGKADPERGRFRSFLKQSLRNYLVDHHRSRRSRGVGAVSVDESLNESPADTSASAFDRDWAAAVIELALQRTEEGCRQDGLDGHWVAFSANVVGPTIRKTNPLPLDELARRIGAADATQASNMLQTVKRRFRRMLREVVAETVADPSHIEQELADLRTCFG